MNPAHTLAIDVDGVVADLHTEWLRRYNRDFGQDLTVAGLHTWKIGDHVVASAKDRIYEYLRDLDLYACIEPMPGAVAAVATLRARGWRVVFVTSCVDRSMYDQKRAWLLNHGLINWKAEDLVACDDKSLVRAHALVDDYEKNLEQFDGRRILFDAPYNRGLEAWKTPVERQIGWDAVLETLGSPGGNIVSMSGVAHPVAPESICLEADRLVSGDRQDAYGHPLDNWTLTAELMTPIARRQLETKGEITAQGALLMMQQVKIGRELNRPKRDNAVDMAGYAKCLDMVNTEKERRATTR